MDVLKYLGLQPSEEYETVKGYLSYYTKQFKALGSKQLTPEERKCFQNRYKRLLNLIEHKNISIKEYGKLQMAIKKFRKKFEHLGFFDYVGNTTTVSAHTKSSLDIAKDKFEEPVREDHFDEKASTHTPTKSSQDIKKDNLEQSVRKDGFGEKPVQETSKNYFFGSDYYYITVSQLENLITSIENSVSFDSVNKRIYELRFHTIRETINEENFTGREIKELLEIHEEYLDRFERIVEKFEQKSKESRDQIASKNKEKKKEDQHNEEKWTVQAKISRSVSDAFDKSPTQSKVARSTRTFSNDYMPRFSISSETFCETVVKVTDLTKKTSFQKFPDSEEISWNFFENMRKNGIYAFLSFNELSSLGKRDKYNVQKSLSYQGLPSDVYDLRDVKDLKLFAITLPNLKSFDSFSGRIKASPHSSKKIDVLRNTRLDEDEAQRRYKANLTIIYYKRLQKLYKTTLSVGKNLGKDNRKAKNSYKKDLAIKPDVKLLKLCSDNFSSDRQQYLQPYKSLLKLEYFPSKPVKTESQVSDKNSLKNQSAIQEFSSQELTQKKRSLVPPERQKREFDLKAYLLNKMNLSAQESKNKSNLEVSSQKRKISSVLETQNKLESHRSSTLSDKENSSQNFSKESQHQDQTVHTKKVSFTTEDAEENYYPRDKNSSSSVIMHRIFRQALDLDSVDSLKKDKDKIDKLHDYARIFDDKVKLFRNVKDSLEFVVLDGELTLLMEKLIKIKCRRDRKATKKKVELIKYVKRLQGILDQRANNIQTL